MRDTICANAQMSSMDKCGKAWYLKVKEKLRGISMKLWEVFTDTVVLKNGMLADGEGQGADGLLTAWSSLQGPSFS